MRPVGLAIPIRQQGWRPYQGRGERLWRRVVFTIILPSFAAAIVIHLLPVVPQADQWEETFSINASSAKQGTSSESLENSSNRSHQGESARLRGRLQTSDDEQQEQISGQGRLASVGLLELQEDTVPWKVAKVLLPLSPQVAKWWSRTDDGEFTVKMRPCSTGGEPHVHLQVWAPQPLELPLGRAVEGLHSIIYLPPGTVLEDCRLDWVHVAVDTKPLAGLGTLRALHISCPVSPRRRDGGFGGTLALSLAVFTWLLLPWPLLLVPTILYSAARPAALGAAFFFARITRCVRRRRRLWRLSFMGRRTVPVDDAFGQEEPCCICFGAQEEEAVIALLPCRHAMHGSCYRSWVCMDSYPSRELICPLCRRQVTAVGKLSG